MNKAALMRIRIDYIQNKTPLDSEEYKRVIEELVVEIERLGARDISNRMIIENLRRK